MATAEEKAAADKAAADKAVADQSDIDKANVTKEAHANAVRRAEEELAAVRAAQLSATKPTLTSFAGIVKGPFVLYGENLGSQRELKIDGHTAKLSAVRADSIKGTVPVDVKPGPVKITMGNVTFDGKVSA